MNDITHWGQMQFVMAPKWDLYLDLGQQIKVISYRRVQLLIAESVQQMFTHSTRNFCNRSLFESFEVRRK